MINLTPVSIEAPNQKLEHIEPAVAPKKKRATRAGSSESTRSARKGAKSASTTKPNNPQRNKIAAFVLKKFVKLEKIVYPRDMPLAYKLADRHLDLEFWRTMIIRNQVDSLVVIWSQESRNRLTRQWSDYKAKLANQRKIVLDKPVPIFIIGDKVGDDYIPAPKRPRSALDFCR